VSSNQLHSIVTLEFAHLTPFWAFTTAAFAISGSMILILLTMSAIAMDVDCVDVVLMQSTSTVMDAVFVCRFVSRTITSATKADWRATVQFVAIC